MANRSDRPKAVPFRLPDSVANHLGAVIAAERESGSNAPVLIMSESNRKVAVAVSIEEYNLLRATKRLALSPRAFFEMIGNRERDEGTPVREIL